MPALIIFGQLSYLRTFKYLTFFTIVDNLFLSQVQLDIGSKLIATVADQVDFILSNLHSFSTKNCFCNKIEQMNFC